MYSLLNKIKSPIVSLLIVTAIGAINFDFIESFRLRFFDLIITEVPRDVDTSQIVSVNIGEDTLARLGQFPFPRNEYAQIIETLYRNGATFVVFNIAMTEPDRFGQDEFFASAIEGMPVVLPYLVGNSDYTPEPIGVSMIGDIDPNEIVPRFPGIIPNVEPIQSAAYGKGISVTIPELDGVVRRLPMVISINGELYPSIVLETLRVLVGDPSFQIKTNLGGVEAVRIPSFSTIETDPLSRVWIDWQQSVESIDFEDVENGVLNGRIAIVGMTAGGITNPVASAIGEIFPHHVQSMALSTAIAGTNISRPDWAYAGEIAAMFLLSILVLIISRYWTHAYLLPILFGLISGFGVVYVFLREQILIDGIFPLLGITTLSNFLKNGDLNFKLKNNLELIFLQPWLKNFRRIRNFYGLEVKQESCLYSLRM
jgi:adenylate cyclase